MPEPTIGDCAVPMHHFGRNGIETDEANRRLNGLPMQTGTRPGAGVPGSVCLSPAEPGGSGGRYTV